VSKQSKLPKKIHKFEPSVPGLHMTLDLHTALANNYLGEIVLRQTTLFDALQMAFLGRVAKPALIYYYGTACKEFEDLLNER
jgi:succinylglutamate desuccinylase